MLVKKTQKGYDIPSKHIFIVLYSRHGFWLLLLWSGYGKRRKVRTKKIGQETAKKIIAELETGKLSEKTFKAIKSFSEYNWRNLNLEVEKLLEKEGVLIYNLYDPSGKTISLQLYDQEEDWQLIINSGLKIINQDEKEKIVAELEKGELSPEFFESIKIKLSYQCGC